jgi:hypothetical protein
MMEKEFPYGEGLEELDCNRLAGALNAGLREAYRCRTPR